MLNPDPIGRITIRQIKRHPWYIVNVPIHLRINESTIDQQFESIIQYRANRNNQPIDEEVLDQVLRMPNFSHLDNVPEVREAILYQSAEDYVVCYELILNEKLKKNRVKLKEVHLP
jgi:hypothetical protein